MWVFSQTIVSENLFPFSEKKWQYKKHRSPEIRSPGLLFCRIVTFYVHYILYCTIFSTACFTAQWHDNSQVFSCHKSTSYFYVALQRKNVEENVEQFFSQICFVSILGCNSLGIFDYKYHEACQHLEAQEPWAQCGCWAQQRSPHVAPALADATESQNSPWDPKALP